MAVFEVEIGGKVYEVDAPDQASAIAAAGQFKPAAPTQADTSGQQQYDALPWYQKAAKAADDMVRIGANAVTLGGADRLAAYMGGTSLEQEKQATKGARERAGSAAYAGDIIGGILPASKAMSAGQAVAKAAAPGLFAKAGYGAATAGAGAVGAGMGATEAILQDENVTTGALGGLAAGSIGKVAGDAAIGAVNKIAGAFNKKPAIPTYDDVVAKRDAAYRAADEADVAFRPEAMQRIRDEAKSVLTNEGYHPANHPGAGVALSELERIAGGNVSLKGLETARKVVSGGYNPTMPDNNRLIGLVRDKIDDLIENPRPSDVLFGDATKGAAALNDGRAAHSQVKKLDLLDDKAYRAELNAGSAGSGANVDNAMRQQIKSILLNPKQSRGLAPDERAAMETVVRGSPGQNALRLAGKLAPTGVVSGVLSGGAGVGLLGPIGAAVPLVGAGAKMLADRSTRSNIDTVRNIILAGGKASALRAPDNAVQRLAKSKRQTLIDMLTAGGLAVGR